MSLPDVFQERDLETRARGVLGEVRDLGVDTLVPAATDRLRDLAGQIRPERYRKQVNELEGDFSKRVRKLERKLERKVKKLPVDTPLDRRRRRRVRRRGAAASVVVIGACGVVAYAWWRSRGEPTRHERDESLGQRDRDPRDNAAGPAARDAAAAGNASS